MNGESGGLEAIVASVADGGAIDWQALDALAADEGERRFLQRLRLIAGVAELHRSTPDVDLLSVALDGHPAAHTPTGFTAAATAHGPRATTDAGRAPLGPGDRWGDIEILEYIGEGAFGDVFRGRDTSLEREVALKVLRGAPLDALTTRVLHEGRTLARVHHDNVVTVFGVDTRDDRVGLWMEYIRGATLDRVMRSQGPYGAKEAAVVGQDLCRALAAVHGAGLVHRDIKARNVMREQGGRIVLMDFGSGQARHESGSGARRIAGTPMYLAPEVLDSADATVRSDVYSVGVLLYHLVTGAYPVQASELAELRAAHASGAVTRLHDVRPDLPDAFVRVVERAMHADPQQRYPSAGALRAALEASMGLEDVLGGQHEPPAPPHPVGQGAQDHGADARTPSTHVARDHPSLRAILPSRRLALVAAILVMVAAAIGMRNGWFAGVAGDVRAVSVLPFENKTGDATADALAQGLTSDVARALRVYDVEVHGRDSARVLRASLAGPVELGARLKVDTLIRGSIERVGDDVDLTVTLVEAEHGELLRTWTHTVSAEALPGVGGIVAREVAGAARLRPRSSTAPPQAHEPSRQAYSYYNVGRHYWTQRTPESLALAVKNLEAAVQLDPSYARAWSGLADAYMDLGVPAFGALAPMDARRLARQSLMKALALEPDLGEAHASLAFASYFYDWDWSGAEDHFKQSLTYDAQYATAHQWYADYLNAMGRPDEALQHLRRAQELEPASLIILRDFGWQYFHHRRYDDAVASLRGVLAFDPNYTPAKTLLARALVQRGDFDEGVRWLESLGPNDMPRTTRLAFLAQALAASGRTAEAEAKVTELLTLSRTAYIAPYYVALVYAALGRTDDALTWLEKGFAEQDTTMVNLKADPRWDVLRGVDRYQALLTRMRFPS